MIMENSKKLEIVKLAVLAFKNGDYANFSLKELSNCGIKDKSLKDGLRELCNLGYLENLTVNGYYPKYKVNYDGECPSYIFDDITPGTKDFLIRADLALKGDYTKMTAKALSKLLYQDEDRSSSVSNFMTKIKSFYKITVFELLENKTYIHLTISHSKYKIESDANGYKLISTPKEGNNYHCTNCGCIDENMFYAKHRTLCRKCYNEHCKKLKQSTIGKFLYNKARQGYRNRPNIAEFSITEEIIERVWDLQNHLDYYTGEPILDINNMSLDRIDSSKGYVEDNICITTIAINIAKNDLSKEDFIEMCKKVANNFTFPEQ